MEKQNNYNKYWRNWNVLQTPKIDLDALGVAGWEVYDANYDKKIVTYAVNEKDNIKLKIEFASTAGIDNIEVFKDNKKIYSQSFSFLLKPSVNEIKKILNLCNIDDWRKYYTAN